MARGFVYVLMNPAIPGYVKIGKTTTSPEQRARELSAATGVPAPFVVVYDAAFADCDRAESYVHALLEGRGVSRTPDREFFAIDLPGAIRIVMDAERHLEPVANGNDSDDPPAAADRETASEPPVWLEILEQAEAYHYGAGDTIEDPERAAVLYEQAARLGAPDAYIGLAELAAGQDDQVEGRRWLVRGAEAGHVACWAVLALVYMRQNLHFRLPPEPENARKAWRRFFRVVEPTPDDPRASYLYVLLRHYVQALQQDRQEAADTEVLRAFTERFADVLSEREQIGKLRELRSLVDDVL